MCGFAGYLSPNSIEHADVLAAMSKTIVHRGPNDHGVWWDENAGIALSHQRLSILDLSLAGHQPMISACERYVVAFNGEIYNHLSLRTELELAAKHTSNFWRGSSDTETLLAAIAFWGVDTTLKKCAGMFAFALWDRKEKKLILARDRMGEKPLYYGFQGTTFLFGSELKALKKHPDFVGEIDRNAITLFLRHNYIPAPHSVYKNIFKLSPGSWIEVSDGQLSEPRIYWSLAGIAETGQENSYKGNEADAIEKLEEILKQSIKGQMAADVPLGAFLSGGIDSSTVVALMQTMTDKPVKTFTIGFSEKGYNEAEYANEVAKHLKTDHTELYVSADQARAIIPDLAKMYDEPFSDPSQIPTWLVSNLAKKQVTVSLSGDGGDELFGGYNRYFIGNSIWQKMSHIPLPLRTMMAGIMTAVSPDRWDAIFAKVIPFLPKKLRFQNPGDKLHKLAGVFRVGSIEQLYLGLVSHWDNPSELVLGSEEPATVLTDQKKWPKVPSFVQKMMALDAMTYLPDDILTKVDRAAMSVSLETRIPMLDHRLVEFAWQLPLSMNIKDGGGKYLLRQVLYKHVPKELIERPKMGFGVPIDSWLRGPLKEWAEELLSESRLKSEGFLDPVPIRKKWNEHISGKRNWQYHLWDILMFQAWLEHWH